MPSCLGCLTATGSDIGEATTLGAAFCSSLEGMKAGSASTSVTLDETIILSDME